MKNRDKPASPVSITHEHHPNGAPKTTSVYMGLSKREMIAAMALQGMLNSKALAHLTVEFQAKKAVEYADALLREFDK